AHPVAAVRCESFQIRANTRPATRIKSRNRQQNRSCRDSLSMEMAHDVLSFASIREENSRSRLPGREALKPRARKRPASANVRGLFFLCKVILQNKIGFQRFKSGTRQAERGN